MKHKLLQLLDNNARADRTAPSIRADASDEVAKVYVYDVIDAYWGASAKGLVEALAGLAGRDVHLHINSPGGDVFEARAMVAAIRAHTGKVDTFIDGLAASAATYLALAGATVSITDGGMFMVHNSWTLAWGNKAELRSTADLLEKIDGTIAADYMRKTSKAQDVVAGWMDAETWFTAAEALAAGFVDQIITVPAPATDATAARWNLSAYANAPKLQPPAPAHVPDTAALTAAAARAARLNRSRLALLQPHI